MHNIPHALIVLLTTIALSLLVDCAAAQQESTAELRAEYDAIAAQYGDRLQRPAPPASGELLFVAGDQYSPAKVDAASEAGTAYAAELFDLARRAAVAGQASLAFQWATEAAACDPSNADARRVLGYELVNGNWLTPYAVRMAERGLEWHGRFGWISPDDAVRYEAGQRKIGSRWIAAEADARRHEHIDDAWQIRTDHFLVTTNHTLEAGAELASRLERLHQVWRQLFAGFYLSDREVRQLFAGERHSRRRSRPFRVICHRDKEEYVDTLRRRQPRIDETLGIYFDAQHEAHFYIGGRGEVADVAALYHEAVHQLFQESQSAARHVGQTANFWIVEGVATYFESLQEHDDPAFGPYFTIGEATAGRLPAARQRILTGSYYLPFAELTRLGKIDLQRHAEIAKLYSQSAGLATFLMHARHGRHREPLVRYLAAVYAGRDTPQSLAELTGLSNAELDADYRQFMRSLP